MKLLLGTKNDGKIAEIRELLSSLSGIELETYHEVPFSDVDETGATFVENALLKAHQIGRETGRPVLCEDAGLEVAALDGAPGVRSARFSGERVDYGRNNELLLAQLRGVDQREARFVAVDALWLPDGQVFVTSGTLSGRIAESLSGEGGFGYDPLFVPVGESRTLAEMETYEKNGFSHRRRATLRMRAILLELLEQGEL
jgi:XTP/dITP diphosphohydrolase